MITATVTSADHELVEGYFSLGEQGTLMVRPGTELYKFLLRRRGRSVSIRMSKGGSRELSRLSREGQ